MLTFADQEGVTPSQIQNKRRELYEMGLYNLGQHYRSLTKSASEPDGKDPYTLENTAQASHESRPA